MLDPIVKLNSVHKSFGTQKVLQGLDWQIEPGQVIGLLGRNGAGKSTLLECLLGLREMDSGTATLFGDPVRKLQDATRARIGYVPQSADLFEWLTPRQMLDYFKAQYPVWNAAKVDGLLARWGFAANGKKNIGQLSVGERQRLSIIRALAHDPQLLILDEPVASLDPVGRRDFLRELIDGVVERNCSVVFSTHILSDLERIALDVAFLMDGKIALQGNLDELQENTRRFCGPAALLDSLKLDVVRRVPRANGELSVIARADAEKVASLRADFVQLQVDTLSLEDLFVEVTQ
jgi:ABC-2 type transport system ATP-binding protein